MRVDSHIHIFPEAASENPQKFAEEHNEPHWLKLVEPDDRPSIQGWADPEQCLRDMDSAGIDVAILQGWYWENGSTCSLHNELYAGIIERWPDRFRAFASFHTSLIEAEPQSLEKVADQGFCGIGELLPHIQGYCILGDAFAATLESLRSLNLWVNFHVTEPAGGDYPGRVDTPLQDFVTLAEKHPKLNIILSHLGGGIAFYAQNPSIRKHLDHVYFDTAAWPLIYSAEAVSSAMRLAGESSVIYGTDYPLRTFPSKPLDSQMSHNLEAFLNLPEHSQNSLNSILSNGSIILPNTHDL